LTEWSDRDPDNNYEVNKGEIVVHVWKIVAALSAWTAIYLLVKICR